MQCNERFLLTMNRALWMAMAAIIKKYRTWITVHDILRDDWFLFQSSGKLLKYACPVYQLEVKWPRENKTKGQIIGISEKEMDRAIRLLSADKEFARRIRCYQPTPEDVDSIIKEASWNYVNLELEVFDKNWNKQLNDIKI